MRYSLPELVQRAKTKQGLLERALAVGKRSYNNLYIELPDNFDFEGTELKGEPLGLVAPPPEPLPEPTVFDLTFNFSKAVSKWVANGAPVVSEEEYNKRSSICDGCEHWDGKARLGLGKCNVPSCGCTKFKRWLKTEKCPLNKWG
jgi:hypothetical protein